MSKGCKTYMRCKSGSFFLLLLFQVAIRVTRGCFCYRVALMSVPEGAFAAIAQIPDVVITTILAWLPSEVCIRML